MRRAFDVDVLRRSLPRPRSPSVAAPFPAHAAWENAAALRIARDTVLAALERHGPPAAGIVDETGMPKKGRHSVGGARQDCGVLGKHDNCQVAVRVSEAHALASLPVAYRLYVPEAWARDGPRRRAAGGPPDVEFRPTWPIALARIVRLQADGGPAATGIAAAGSGVVTVFRDQLTAAAIPYAVGMTGAPTGWPPGRAPVPPKRYGGRGRPPSLIRHPARHRPCRAAKHGC